jgi:hypothetical protein
MSFDIIAFVGKLKNLKWIITSLLIVVVALAKKR